MFYRSALSAFKEKSGYVRYRVQLTIGPEVSGSYHIPRQEPFKDDYSWVSHSAPPSSLITLMSLRCGEIVNDSSLLSE